MSLVFQTNPSDLLSVICPVLPCDTHTKKKPFLFYIFLIRENSPCRKLPPGRDYLCNRPVLIHTVILPRPVPTTYTHTSLQPLRNLRISFRVLRSMMPPLECSFRTIPIPPKLLHGRFYSVHHALQHRTTPGTKRPRSFLRNQPDRYFH